jgi:hypothetical protein
VTTLAELVTRLDDLNDELVIFAVRPWDADSEAVAVLDFEAPEGFSYVLEVPTAAETLHVWSAWRAGKAPEAEEAVAAVLHYAEHDAYEPGPA